MMNMMKNVICKKDKGDFDKIITEAAFAAGTIVLVIVGVKFGKPLVEEWIKLASEEAKKIFTLF